MIQIDGRYWRCVGPRAPLKLYVPRSVLRAPNSRTYSHTCRLALPSHAPSPALMLRLGHSRSVSGSRAPSRALTLRLELRLTLRMFHLALSHSAHTVAALHPRYYCAIHSYSYREETYPKRRHLDWPKLPPPPSLGRVSFLFSPVPLQLVSERLHEGILGCGGSHVWRQRPIAFVGKPQFEFEFDIG